MLERKWRIDPMDMRATQALCIGNKFGLFQSGRCCHYAFFGNNEGYPLPLGRSKTAEKHCQGLGTVEARLAAKSED